MLELSVKYISFERKGWEFSQPFLFSVFFSKRHMNRILFIICSSLFWNLNSFAQEKEPDLKHLFNEFHVSVNHGIPLYPEDRTFFGTGFGAGKVFRAEKIVAFRSGLELQLFHCWQSNSDDPKPYSENIHSYFVDFSVPLALRINISHFFVEFGGNVGVGVGGRKHETVYSSSMGQAVMTVQKSRTGSGFWLGPAFGIGTLIPLNERMDLLIRPDVQLNWQIYNGMDLYGRLCIGVHLK